MIYIRYYIRARTNGLLIDKRYSEDRSFPALVKDIQRQLIRKIKQAAGLYQSRIENNMNERELLKLIRQGEGISTEFKTCRNHLNRDVYESVCAFLNRHGGTILLGVQDSGEVTGIDPDAVTQIKKDFVTSINNPQKIKPPAYLSVDEAEINEKSRHRCVFPGNSPRR